MNAVISYMTHSDTWEQNATIRTRPRRIVEDDGKRYYPIERQPLCAHPYISELPEEKIEFILLQSLYKYMNDIIIFETEIVNKTAREISRGVFPFAFPFDCRYDALSVVIDEDYHAYVAMDYMHQVEQATGIAPIYLPDKIELSIAIPTAMDKLPDQYKPGMELLGVAIAENTVTAEVAAFSRDTTLKRSVKGLMADHLVDEGRHSSFWANMVKLYWNAIDEPARVAIGEVLPFFLKTYLTNELQADFDRRLVAVLGLGEMADEISRDLVSAYPITESHPMISNIRNLLLRSGVMEHGPTRAALAEIIPG